MSFDESVNLFVSNNHSICDDVLIYANEVYLPIE